MGVKSPSHSFAAAHPPSDRSDPSDPSDMSDMSDRSRVNPFTARGQTKNVNQTHTKKLAKQAFMVDNLGKLNSIK